MSYHTTAALNDTGSEVKKPHDDLDLDEIYTILSNSRRRAAIRYIDRVGSCPFGELVDVVADAEDAENRQAVYIALYQSHMDRLKDAGIIDFERRSGQIHVGPNVDLVLAHLRPSIGQRIKQTILR